MQLCRLPDFVSHVRQRFADRDRNRRRCIARNRGDGLQNQLNRESLKHNSAETRVP